MMAVNTTTAGGASQRLQAAKAGSAFKPSARAARSSCRRFSAPVQSFLKNGEQKSEQETGLSKVAKDKDPGWGERHYKVDHLNERPAPKGLEGRLVEAGQPTMVSRDREHPQGTYEEAQMTPLQSHVAFFDEDGDGVIWPGDTYRGFRRVGFSRTISALAVPMIHGAFSPVTQPPGKKLPDPLFRVNIHHIHKAKHGSDSETYDTEGRWVAQKFEEVFSKYARTYDNALTWDELSTMTAGNKNVLDFFGWTAEKLEWYATYLLVGRPIEEGGPKVLTKDDARGILDGTLFYRIEADLKEGKIEGRGATEAGFKKKGE